MTESGLARADRELDGLPPGAGAVVLVEGESDAAAVETLVARFGHLGPQRPFVLAAHGITNYPRLLARLSAEHPDRRVTGLYDEAEERVVQRAVRVLSPGTEPSRAGLERLGFFACVADLEDEFIRALGTERVEELVAEEGELPAFRLLQQQPAQRDRSLAQQLRRFAGTKSLRKIRYGALFAAAVDLSRCPEPVRRLIETAAA